MTITEVKNYSDMTYSELVTELNTLTENIQWCEENASANDPQADVCRELRSMVVAAMARIVARDAPKFFGEPKQFNPHLAGCACLQCSPNEQYLEEMRFGW